jgi:hypothetical protein
MIKEVTMYTVICDNCGVDSNENAEYACWDDKSYAEKSAMEDTWIKENHKHYCKDCWEYNDDDEIVIKNKFNK